jgi:hypothetical protein
MPKKYLEYRPFNIFIVHSSELGGDENSDAAQVPAFTSGPNIYITELGMQDLNADKDNNEYFKSLFHHEWMHLIQFFKVFTENSEEELQQNFTNITLYQAQSKTQFMTDYAAQVGWENPGEESRKLKNDEESQRQSVYGKSHPNEDQAETGTYYFSDKTQISKPRTKWMEDFLK